MMYDSKYFGFHNIGIVVIKLPYITVFNVVVKVVAFSMSMDDVGCFVLIDLGFTSYELTHANHGVS